MGRASGGGGRKGGGGKGASAQPDPAAMGREEFARYFNAQMAKADSLERRAQGLRSKMGSAGANNTALSNASKELLSRRQDIVNRATNLLVSRGNG